MKYGIVYDFELVAVWELEEHIFQSEFHALRATWVSSNDRRVLLYVDMDAVPVEGDLVVILKRNLEMKPSIAYLSKHIYDDAYVVNNQQGFGWVVSSDMFAVLGIMPDQRTPETPSGDITIRMPDKHLFRCACGCNVFRKPRPITQPNTYKCNACESLYSGN